MTSRDPISLVQRLQKPSLPKRFYREASIGEGAGGFALLLDGKPTRTPAKLPLVVPTRALAEMIAAEWAGQTEHIDPATMPVTRLVNVALDAVVPNPAPVRAEIVKYARSDLLCYRAGEPEGLVASQTRHWDPILAWAREALGARFILSEGVTFVDQPASAIAAIEGAVAAYDGLALAALEIMTTLTGSALIALGLTRGALSLDAAWAAAHVDEDWNIALWGEDEEAMARRARRFTEMQAAEAVIRGG